MSRRVNLYTGRAGHLAVMAEFLLRGWNTAIPEVDVGDDIFVVRDRDGNLRRVQVKTAKARHTRRGYNAVFSLSLTQLRTPVTPEVTYVFAVRVDDRWDAFVLIERSALHEEHGVHGIGSERGDQLTVRMRLVGDRLVCGSRDLTRYRGDWSKFPVIEH